MLSRLILVVFTFLAAGSAAADTRPQPRWDGLYGGFHGGVVRGDGAVRLGDFSGAIIALDVENGIFPTRRSPSDIAALGGGFVGYAVRRGAFLGAVEADLSLTNSEARASLTRLDTDPASMFSGTTTTTRYVTELDALAAVRLRGGMVAGRTHFYGTVGVAAGRVENRFRLAFDEASPIGSYDTTWRERDVRVGYIVGGGIERQLASGLTLRGEFLHYDLQDATVRARDAVLFPGQAIDYRFRNRGEVVRLGILARF